jgi:hypothetical protein
MDTKNFSLPADVIKIIKDHAERLATNDNRACSDSAALCVIVREWVDSKEQERAQKFSQPTPSSTPCRTR